MKKKLLVLSLSLLLAFPLSSCGKEANSSSSNEEGTSSSFSSTDTGNSSSSTSTTTEEKIAKITLELKNPSKTEVEPGETLQFVAYRENIPFEEKTIFLSSNSEVLSIDETGLATAKKEGSATITAKVNETVSEGITIVVKKKAQKGENYAQIKALFEKAMSLDASKQSGGSLEKKHNEFFNGKTNVSLIDSYDVSSYLDEKTEVKISKGEMVEDKLVATKTALSFGKAYNRLVTVYSNYNEPTEEGTEGSYSINTLRSNSKKIVDVPSNKEEVSLKEANSLASFGQVDTYSGLLDFIYNGYLLNSNEFAEENLSANLALETKDNVYTISGDTSATDSNGTKLIYSHSMTLSFNTDGYLTSASGVTSIFKAGTDNEKGEKTVEESFTLSMKNTPRVNAPSSLSFEQYFFTDFTPALIENNQVVDVVDFSKFYKIGVKTSSPETAQICIDPVSIKKVLVNGTEGTEGSHYLLKDGTIAFLATGSYEVVVSSANKEASITFSLEGKFTSSVAFKSFSSFTYGIENEYIGSAILAGRAHRFALEIDGDVIDDTVVEFEGDNLGATISKVGDASATYILNVPQDKKGTLTLVAYSRGLGKTLGDRKTVKVYPNTDAGITSFLTECTWTSTSVLSKVEFTKTKDNGGSFGITYAGKDYTGTFEVSSLNISFTNAATGNMGLFKITIYGGGSVIGCSTLKNTLSREFKAGN